MKHIKLFEAFGEETESPNFKWSCSSNYHSLDERRDEEGSDSFVIVTSTPDFGDDSELFDVIQGEYLDSEFSYGQIESYDDGSLDFSASVDRMGGMCAGYIKIQGPEETAEKPGYYPA